MKLRLKGKSVVITGGAGGIGLATAQKMLNEGADGILLVDLNEDSLKEAISELNSDKVNYITADVSKNDDVKKYTEKAIDLFGRIDILFLNAGIEGEVKPITEYPEELFDKLMDINVKGVWLGMKHAFPYMQENDRGSIIITSSVAGLEGTPNVSAYVTSKHAIVGAMKVGALEGAEHNIRVNSIHPSPVDNSMMRSLEEGFAPGNAKEAKKSFEQSIPLGRYGKNEEMADLALFLASDESKFITGAKHVIDGGMTV
ncbi:MAG: SDR family NAD(P)-dependent oxidoreductase [bacterium]